MSTGSMAPPATPSTWHHACQYLTTLDLSRAALQQRFLSVRDPLGFSLTTISAKKRKNAACNRYYNILPYDHNCVKIAASGADGSRGKYINASMLKADAADNVQWSYIATQGPLPHTVADFWQMVVENNCVAIVMLTQVLEGSTSKCCQYFPDQPGQVLQVPGVRVECQSSVPLSNNTISKRAFEVCLEGAQGSSSFQCSHYLMNSWPDHGAPSECRSLRELIQVVNDVTRARGGLACVHCSAGVGRTGTYVAIDIIMRRLHYLAQLNAGPVDVAAAMDVETLISQLRTQRTAMVQSVEQLQFIYMTLREFVQAVVVGTT